tara:strand:+ start:200 stop:898 length:699 start_codon:yes stop_codon:yes gene_type:complete
MEIIQKTPEKIVLRTNAGYNLANAIRRSVEEIQVLAIDEVEIFKNDSALYDEVLAHRIGLVPLKTEPKMGPKTEVSLKLKKTGPGKVYSGDFEGSAKIVFDKIPLTLLENKQEVEIVATAKLGSGIEHAKYIPGLVYYRNLQEVKSGDSKIEEIVKNSSGEIKPEKKGSKWVCDLNEAEVDDLKKLNNDCVEDSNELLVFVESFGHLDSEKILSHAIDILKKNLKEFEKAVK